MTAIKKDGTLDERSQKWIKDFQFLLDSCPFGYTDNVAAFMSCCKKMTFYNDKLMQKAIDNSDPFYKTKELSHYISKDPEMLLGEVSLRFKINS